MRLKSPHPPFGHLLPREAAREKAITSSTAFYDDSLLPFAPSQMGEGGDSRMRALSGPRAISVGADT
jgi:hypothetical protein